MPISRRLRYEVLRRDDYRCRYCGATAEHTRLTVDHVHPVSLGGASEPANLITACGECNAGKSSSVPDAPLVDQVSADALRWSSAMRRAGEIQSADRAAVAEYCGKFSDAWGDDYSLPQDWKQSIEAWHGLGIEIEILCDCVDAAMNAYGVQRRWKYFCGVVWNTVRDRQQIARELVDGEA